MEASEIYIAMSSGRPTTPVAGGGDDVVACDHTSSLDTYYGTVGTLNFTVTSEVSPYSLDMLHAK